MALAKGRLALLHAVWSLAIIVLLQELIRSWAVLVGVPADTF